MSSSAAPLLDEVQAAWMLGPVSISIATGDAEGNPTIAVGLGVRIAADRCRLTVFVLDSTSRETLANVRAGRPIAVAFTNSASARALQVKARSAVVAARVTGDDERIGAYADALSREWAGQGQPASFAYGVLCRAPGEVVALELAPYALFDQSPGPRAGDVLAGHP